jgi:hypothetical protein
LLLSCQRPFFEWIPTTQRSADDVFDILATVSAHAFAHVIAGPSSIAVDQIGFNGEPYKFSGNDIVAAEMTDHRMRIRAFVGLLLSSSAGRGTQSSA